jgi:amino-acid N-acetyltransferase
VSDSIQDYVNWFRHSSPYINAHRGKTLVLTLEGEALACANFGNIIHDIALLNSLGVRLVLVYGSRPQIEAKLKAQGVKSRLHRGLRVTDEVVLASVKEASGSLRSDIEARLSMGLPNSPMHGARIRVCSGNFVTAKPLGVVDGVDYCHTGTVRKVDRSAIEGLLDGGAIVLLSNLGFSSTGEIFNLAVDEVAEQSAIALKADKLICFCAQSGLTDESGERQSELLTRDAEQRLKSDDRSLPEALKSALRALIGACRGGVARGHLLSYKEDGALLSELFTREGAGTLLIRESYEQIRPATIEDVGGLLELIQPLEDSGALVRRSREVLETEIERFVLVERDGAIIGCAALYPFVEGAENNGSAGELACVAVHPDYQGGQRGDQLLAAIEKSARQQRLKRLFVLTTLTAHWFLERGFVEVGPERLPEQKQSLYNLQRNSKVFEKRL